MSALNRVSIIGTGRLGRCLALVLHETGFNIYSLFNRTVPVAEKLVTGDNSGSIVKAFPESKDDLAPLTFICVPDDAITRVAEKLGNITDDWSGFAFVHCSGARPAGELKVLAGLGAKVASFHPIQTFPIEPDAAIFRKIWISLQGDDELLGLLEQYADALGGKAVRITAEQKQQLHIAAVFASNYVVALAGAAEKLLPGEHPDMEMLAPLMRQTLEQILSQGPTRALTGPLRRGDLQTLRNHIDRLKEYPELQSLYTSIGRYTVTLIKEMPSKPDNIDQVLKLFETK